ncbi:MAG: tetratricopeptide repeat protein [Pseudomonadota bacterium]
MNQKDHLVNHLGILIMKMKHISPRTLFALVFVCASVSGTSWASMLSPTAPPMNAVLNSAGLISSTDRPRQLHKPESTQSLSAAAKALLQKDLINSKRQAAKAAYELGVDAMKKGNLNIAHAFIREAVQLHSTNPMYLQIAIRITYGTGRYTEAEAYQTKFLKILLSELEPSDPRIAGEIDILATIYLVQRRYQDAELLFSKGLKIRAQSLGATHPTVAVSLNRLASLSIHQNRPQEAERLLKRAVNILKDAYGADHSNTAAAMHNLADFYRTLERFSEAESLYCKAIAIWEAEPSDALKHAVSLKGLGSLYASQKRFDDAQYQFEQMHSLLQETLGSDHPYVGAAKNSLVTLKRERAQFSQTSSTYQAAAEDVRTDQ